MTGFDRHLRNFETFSLCPRYDTSVQHNKTTMASKRKADGSIAGSSSAANLTELFSRLTLAASSNDYEKVVTISDQVLASSPGNIKAAKQKLNALIHLDKYSEALSFLEKSTFLDAKKVVLEKGFCLYKLGKGEEAEKILEQGSGRAILHIRAQNVSSSSVLWVETNCRHIVWRNLIEPSRFMRN